MKIALNPVREQVMVITDASRGIGLATAKQAARRGARVVLVSTDESSLNRAIVDIRRSGGRAIGVVADVADAEHMQRVAEAALAEFGRIDTWVNTGPSQVYGSHTAIRQLRRGGGALINVADAHGDRGALKGFTDALRTRLDEERAPIAVTLIDATSADAIVAAAQRPAAI